MANTQDNSTLAHRYATALLELATEQGCVDSCAKDLRALQAVLLGSRELRDAIRNPSYDRGQLAAAMAEIMESLKAHELSHKFIKLLSVKNRLAVLQGIIQAFLVEIAKLHGETQADIITATKLSAEEEAKLTETLQKTVSKNITVNTQIDESLIGGFIVKVGSKMIDASTRTQLLTLANNMKG